MYTDGSSCLPTLDSFQFHIPLTSTPKRSYRSSSHLQPLSSTLSLSTDTSKPMDLSISAITSSPLPFNPKRSRCSQRRRTSQLYPSTIIKKIELKHLLYSTRSMKHQQMKHMQFTEADMKIYLV